MIQRERTHVLDEKSIAPSKIKISWAMGDSIPYSVPSRFLLGSQSVPYGLWLYVFADENGMYCLPYSPRTKSRLNIYIHICLRVSPATIFHLWILVMRHNFLKGLYISQFGFEKFPASIDLFANISFAH